MRLIYSKKGKLLPETQYRPVAWQPMDVATNDKLSQMSTNIDWLRDNTPRTLYRFGVSRWTGVKIVAGIATIAASKESRAAVDVHFPEVFTTDCRPIITTGIIAHQRRIHVTTTGIGEFFPDERGFRIFVQMDNPDAKKNKIEHKVYVPWQAIGY